MSLLLVVAASAAVLALAYRLYGRFLARQFEVTDANAVPSESMRDGVDFVPTPFFVVLGHHFSSIAGAGPIVGPVLAGLYFGWLPALLWIVLGCIFIGGVHDFGTLMASIRHRAASIADVARRYMSPMAGRLFLLFIWLALVYVIIAFLDLTAQTFADDGAVASASILFMVLAVALGLTLRRLGLPMWAVLVIFVPLLFGCVELGILVPFGELAAMPETFGSTKRTWALILLAYCFVASVIPVWLLLQPRDFLSSFLLYGAIIGGAIGLVIGVAAGVGTDAAPLELNWPAFVSAADLEGIGKTPLGLLFPILFITVACGACSGFHSLVSSGTTARQISSERNAMRVGYGAMLIEGFVAVIALMTVGVLTFSAESFGHPLAVFSTGVSRFLAGLGIPLAWGQTFGLLAISTFLLTTLDTCTRLTRFIVQDVLRLDNRNAKHRYLATLATLAVPTAAVFVDYRDPVSGAPVPIWKAIWPIFGATNQLLAGLALLAVTIWLKRVGRSYWFAALPMAGMLAVTMTALAMMIWENTAVRSVLWRGLGIGAPDDAAAPATVIDYTIGGCAAALFTLGLLLIVEACRAFGLGPSNREEILPASQTGRAAAPTT